MTTLFSRRARARRAAHTLALLERWAALAGRRLARLALEGHAHSPAAAWLSDLLGRLGAALHRVRRWVEGEYV